MWRDIIIYILIFISWTKCTTSRLKCRIHYDWWDLEFHLDEGLRRVVTLNSWSRWKVTTRYLSFLDLWMATVRRLGNKFGEADRQGIYYRLIVRHTRQKLKNGAKTKIDGLRLPYLYIVWFPFVLDFFQWTKSYARNVTCMYIYAKFLGYPTYCLFLYTPVDLNLYSIAASLCYEEAYQHIDKKWQNQDSHQN